MRKHACFLLLAAAGCSGAPPVPPEGYPLVDRPSGLPDSVTTYKVTQLLAPAHAGEYAWSWSSDEHAQSHNRLGAVLSMIEMGYQPADPIQARYDRAVADGTIGMTLYLERYPDGAAANTGVTVDTNFANDGFTTLWGRRDGDRVEATGGDMGLSLAVLGDLHLRADAMRISATVEPDGALRGQINGVVPARELRKVWPVVADAMNAYVRDRPMDGDAKWTLQLFDLDRDGTITPDELAQSTLLAPLAAPDVQVTPAEADPVTGLSFGLGFVARPE